MLQISSFKLKCQQQCLPWSPTFSISHTPFPDSAGYDQYIGWAARVEWGCATSKCLKVSIPDHTCSLSTLYQLAHLYVKHIDCFSSKHCAFLWRNSECVCPAAGQWEPHSFHDGKYFSCYWDGEFSLISRSLACIHSLFPLCDVLG